MLSTSDKIQNKGEIVYGELFKSDDPDTPVGLTVTYTPDSSGKVYRDSRVPSLKLEIECESSLREDEYNEIIWNGEKDGIEYVRF